VDLVVVVVELAVVEPKGLLVARVTRQVHHLHKVIMVEPVGIKIIRMAVVVVVGLMRQGVMLLFLGVEMEGLELLLQFLERPLLIAEVVVVVQMMGH
jgi:hypothetical protein